MESELEAIVRRLVEARWPFRLHATYDESIRRFLDVFERVDRDVPFAGLRWFFDHAETISPQSIDRVARLGGGIAVQHRMAYQGEAFVRRYGAAAALAAPPVKRMLAAGIPVGAGTDGTRVASYHPWTCLWWLVTGHTVGGTPVMGEAERLDRLQALRLYTQGSAWFSGDADVKGTLAPGQLADLAVLTDDYFEVAEDRIRDIESVLTIVGGRIVHAAQEHAALAPQLPPVSPGWSPVARWGGYDSQGSHAHAHGGDAGRIMGADGRLWGEGCGCDA